jgi:hypothetical protein
LVTGPRKNKPTVIKVTAFQNDECIFFVPALQVAAIVVEVAKNISATSCGFFGYQNKGISKSKDYGRN